MNANSLETADFSVSYEEATQTLHMGGEIRLLRSLWVEQFNTLLNRSLDFQTSLTQWDLSKLTYMDSAAQQCLYAVLARFRRKESLIVRIYANDEVRVQQKLVPNLKQFFPAAEIYYLTTADR